MKDQQSRELTRIRTACRAVYLYDNANKYTLIRPRRNEEQKVDKLRKRHYTRMAVLQSLINRLGKGRGKKEKKVIATLRGIRIWSPTQVLTPANRA